MTAPAGAVLDVADLVVIVGRTLGIGTDAALAEMDIAAAETVLAEAPWPTTAFPNRAAAASASVALMHALLRHRPFPRNGEQVAVAAALQFLSLNGWQADLNPPAPAAVVVEALASGQLTPGAAADWLAPRLTPTRHTSHGVPRLSLGLPHRLPVLRVPLSASVQPISASRWGSASRSASAGRPVSARRSASAVRAAASILLAVTVGGVTLLAAACSSMPNTPVTPSGQVPVVRQTPGPVSASVQSAGCPEIPVQEYLMLPCP